MVTRSLRSQVPGPPGVAALGCSVRAPGPMALSLFRGPILERRRIMWWNKWWQHSASGRHVKPRPRCRPQLEVLEDRSLPSAYGFATSPQPPNAGAQQGSAAFGINASGQIVGFSADANNV